MFLPQGARPSFAPIQHNWKITVLYVLIFSFFIWDGKRKDFGLNDSKHSLNLICSWFHHDCHSDLLVSYLNFNTLSNDSVATLTFWFCPEFGWDMIIYFV
jgi:hypothetical protein